MDNAIPEEQAGGSGLLCLTVNKDKYAVPGAENVSATPKGIVVIPGELGGCGSLDPRRAYVGIAGRGVIVSGTAGSDVRVRAAIPYREGGRDDQYSGRTDRQRVARSERHFKGGIRNLEQGQWNCRGVEGKVERGEPSEDVAPSPGRPRDRFLSWNWWRIS